MKVHSLVTTLLIPSALLSADPIEESKEFEIQSNSVTTAGLATISSNGGLIGDTAEVTYGGEFHATFTFDSDTLEVESFTFTGEGEMTTDPYSLFFQGFIDYDLGGSTSTTVQRSPQPSPLSQIKFVPETRNGVDGLVKADGTLDNSNYFLRAYSGGYAITWAIQGAAQNPTIVNYTELNPSLLFLKGVSTPTIEEISSTVHERTLQATLTIELDESQIMTLSANLPRNNLDVFDTESGTITAKTGHIKLNTDYGDWADENGLDKPDPEDTNNAGLPYGMLYALDLPADATLLPIRTTNSPDLPVTTIDLPEGGLRNPLRVAYTTDLSLTLWPDLPDANYLDGTASLDSGATGSPRFTFPEGSFGFMRFTTSVE